ncbi:unnamed protein product [Penicillium viridicatum]
MDIIRRYINHFFKTRDQIPDKYTQIRARPGTGIPGIIFARSFTHPVIQQTLTAARLFQFSQLRFIDHIYKLLNQFEENLRDRSKKERSSSQWRRMAPFLERDLRQE